MNPPRAFLLLLGALALTACGGGGGGGGDVLPDDGVPAVAVTASFAHTAHVDNTVGYMTYVDHPIANGSPGAYLLVTPAYVPDPHGGLGTYVNHDVGVRYVASDARWAICYLDHAPLPVGAVFHVTVSSGWNANPTAFHLQRTNAGNIDFLRTFVDHPAANGNPDAVLVVTPNCTPDGVLARNHDHPIGVVYDETTARWAVYNRDSAPMEDDTAFNVAILGTGGASPFATVVEHVATAGTIVAGNTRLGLPDGSDAILQATVRFEPGGGLGSAYGKRFGVTHVGGTWSIFSQDSTAMTAGPRWNVAVAGR